jgi:hypothetical protein
LDTILLKKPDRPPAHSSTEHNIHPLFFDKSGNLTRLMGAIIRIFDDPTRLDLFPFHIHQGKIRTAAKMVGYIAI